MIGTNAWPATAPRPPKDQILGGRRPRRGALFRADDQQAGRAAGPDPLVKLHAKLARAEQHPRARQATQTPPRRAALKKGW